MTTFRLAFLLGALVALPGLGSVGLWDPWETHYVEVGRQMLARADLVHPYWEHAFFFSKPPLVPWLSALGLWLSGAQPWGAPGDGRLPDRIEWFVRLPIALLLVLAGAVLAWSLEQLASRRVGLLAALVFWTMPLTGFLSRQVMMDGPFVALLVIAVSCALVERWRPAFTAIGFALLAKGLLGFLPLVLIPLGWAASEGVAAAWKRLRTVPWWGPLLSLGIAAPWYLAMARFEGRDEEGRRFVERFFFYDHFDRLVNGVHTTTPGGSFTYFIEQGAFAVAPWVALVPLAVFAAPRLPPRAELARRTWALASLTCFALFTSSATRFHHYVFPMLPGLAVLIAFALDAVWTEGLAGRRALLAAGAVLSALVWKDLWQRPRHLLDLFTYNHERPYPDEVLVTPFPFRAALLGLAVVAVLALSITLLRHDARRLVQTSTAMAVACTALVLWQHWPALGRHWTQRALTDRYFAARVDHQPLSAFLMNWKGETLYTRNEVTQISARDPRGELTSLALQPGRLFVVVEHARLPMLRSLAPAGQAITPIDVDSNNKFALVALDD
ncbi:MAG: phospholipid carrier-dependent glycosyltransferase [Myxococcaceae bacterium]